LTWAGASFPLRLSADVVGPESPCGPLQRKSSCKNDLYLPPNHSDLPGPTAFADRPAVLLRCRGWPPDCLRQWESIRVPGGAPPPAASLQLQAAAS
jgi:hypothetical protein